MTGTASPQRFAKVTISLPQRVLSAVDRLQRKTGTSRSEIFRRAIEELFAAERERAEERRWLSAYREQLQREVESAWSEVALASLEANPWDLPAAPSRPDQPVRRTKHGRATVVFKAVRTPLIAVS